MISSVAHAYLVLNREVCPELNTIMFEKLKNLAILEKPEVTFKRQLSKNPYYPFEKIDENRKWRDGNL